MPDRSHPGPRTEHWTKARLDAFLSGEAVSPGAAGSYLAAGSNAGVEWGWLPGAASGSPTGLFMVRLPERLVALAPPFRPEPPFEPWADCLDRTLARRRLLGVVLLRLGHYAVGVVDNGGVIASKSGARYVHGRHRAGGQSQRRWERNREQWIEKLFDEVCAAWSGVVAGHDTSLDGLALGGDRLVLGRFLKHCPAAGRFADRVLARRLEVDRPGAAALARASQQAWSCAAHITDLPVESLHGGADRAG